MNGRRRCGKNIYWDNFIIYTIIIMLYTTRLGNVYDPSDNFIDCDMPYGDYNELIELEFQNLAGTMDWWCGYEFHCKDTDIITVHPVLNQENDQKIVYVYIPESEIYDFDLEIQKQRSSQYTDYQDTLADRLNGDCPDGIREDIMDLRRELEEDDLEKKERELIMEEIDELNDRLEDVLDIWKEIENIEKKCTWNSWSA